MEALAAIILVGGLSLLAQWGRKNRSAEISLIVIVLFISLLVVLLGVLVALIGASGVIPASDLPRELSASSAAVIVLAGLTGLALCVPPLRRVTGRHHALAGYAKEPDLASQDPESFTASNRSSGDRGRGGWWSDPVIFFALWLFVIVLAYDAINFLFFVLAPDVIDTLFAQTGRVTPFVVVVGELPLAIIAFCGVGIGVRRSFRGSIARLGYGPISLSQLGIVALFVVGALLLSFAADALFAALQPDLFERVGEVSEGLFSPAGLSPIAAILFALLIGIGAGLGEETLFRGAVQPALGIPLTSVLFASAHSQYGPSLLLGYLFLISVGLGLLRKRINTTASFIAHASYNSLGVLLTYFLGI